MLSAHIANITMKKRRILTTCHRDYYCKFTVAPSVSSINTVFPRSVAVATINFSFTEVRRLFEGGVYSRAAFILPAGLPPFPATPPVLM